MSEQALDLRRSARILRRRKGVVGIAVALGLLAGAAFAALGPPMLTSTALVVLPQSAQAQQGALVSDNGGIDPYTATQQVIAASNAVLSDALPNARPAMSVGELRRDIQISSPTSYIISVSAKGKVAADAEATANAVAESYISYISSANSPAGQVSAQLLQSATNASGSGSLLKQILLFGLIGAASGALIGAIVTLAIGRNDRRLRGRDEIADAIGVPVLASVSVAHPSDAASWMKVLAEYDPAAVDAWRLRKAMNQLGLVGSNPSEPPAGSGGASLAVLSLSTDRKALALGPQLAVFAASIGIPTTLVVGPHQDANAAAMLHAACIGTVPERSRQLRVATCDGEDADQLPGVGLTVVVAVVDGKVPRVADTMHTVATVLGVSAGAATAEQLARVAISAAMSGRDIAGILVADPDPADHTTGRVPRPARQGLRTVPTRMTGATTETRP
jgi:capsular polysaccharide biosynthesis protein